MSVVLAITLPPRLAEMAEEPATLVSDLGSLAVAANATRIAKDTIDGFAEVAELNGFARSQREELPALQALWRAKSEQDRILSAQLFDARCWLLLIAAFEPEIRALIERPDIRAVVSAMASRPPPPN